MTNISRLYPRGLLAHQKGLVASSAFELPEYYLPLDFGPLRVWFDDQYSPSVARCGEVAVLIYGVAIYVPPLRADGVATADLGVIARMLAGGLSSSDKRFLEVLDFLAGRYVVIVEVNGLIRVFHDAHGTRTVYYGVEHRVFSSHAHLLASFIGDAKRDTAAMREDRCWGVLPLSFAWDETPYRQIRALLPNHYLELEGRHVRRYFPREPNRFGHLSMSERLAEIDHLWNSQMRALARVTNRFIVSLSGGLDS